MVLLVCNMSLGDPQFLSRFRQSLHSSIASGQGYDTAMQSAATTFYTTLQQQGLLLGIKTIIGYMILFAIVLSVVSAFIPFHKTVKVKILRGGDDMV